MLVASVHMLLENVQGDTKCSNVRRTKRNNSRSKLKAATFLIGPGVKFDVVV